MGIARWALLAAVLTLASACADAGQAPQAVNSPAPGPTSNTVSLTATPAVAPPTAAPQSDGTALLARVVEGLDRAKSYRFTIEAVHHWIGPGGEANDWAFNGEGAAVPPNRFRSVMRGPADVMFEVMMIDGKVTNTDTRGQRPDASTAFGGPGVGASPFTAISYLRNSMARGQVQAASLNGVETRQLNFDPDLAKVSAMDASHRGLQEKVQAVQGILWVDARTNRISQETVTVQSTDSQGQPQTVTITMKFTDYDAPVEIK